MKILFRHSVTGRRLSFLRAWGLLLMIGCLGVWFDCPAIQADLRSPAWYDPNGVGAAPDWHYRIPITIPSSAVERSTIRMDVDFDDLLSQMGVGGTFDPNSPRVVRSNGALAATQQFTPDPTDNRIGEIRFLLEDNGAVIYHLYFDVTENGAKTPWPVANTINGNFEFSTDNQQDPPGWNGRGWSSYNAFAIANEFNRTVTTNAGLPTSVVTDEVARTGEFCYLIGSRNTNEAQNRNPSARLERTIDVPAANPGRLLLRYRVKGWDSSANGSSQWDFIRITLRIGNTTVANLVGPAAGNYTTLPFSPNLGTGQANTTQSGYGQYNGWDTDTTGSHRSGMTINPGTEPWFAVNVDLSSYTNQSLTLRIETRNSVLYKSWFHIDDVEWSVVEGELGSPQPFGVDITTPNAATVYTNGDTLTILAQVDAGVVAASADLFNPVGVLVADDIPLFNDGSHGDGTAADGIWTNNGSLPADPTYTFLTTDLPGTDWQVLVTVQDSQISVTDAQLFTLVTPPNIMLLKSVLTESDPVNGSVNPKAIPGATVAYTIIASNFGGTGTDGDSVFVTDPVPANTALFVGNPVQPGGPLVFTDGWVSSGLSFNPANDLRFSDNNGSTFNLDIGDLTADADGCDASITHWRVNPKGNFTAAQNGNVPQFTLWFRVKVQ